MWLYTDIEHILCIVSRFFLIFTNQPPDLITQLTRFGEGEATPYMLWLAIINAPACKQDIFRLTLFATKMLVRLKLSAIRLRLFATSLQSLLSGSH
jgi:hypothetical protein